MFINTSRGEVLDTQALLNRLQEKPSRTTVLDVWESEPTINWELFNRVSLGTPHIAGYSLDGKAQGTWFIYQALCNHLGLTPSWSPTHSLPAPAVPHLTIDPREKPVEHILSDLATAIYDIEADHGRMAALLTIPPEDRPLAFDRLRKHYPTRREFHQTKVNVLKRETTFERQVALVGIQIRRIKVTRGPGGHRYSSGGNYDAGKKASNQFFGSSASSDDFFYPFRDWNEGIP